MLDEDRHESPPGIRIGCGLVIIATGLSIAILKTGCAWGAVSHFFD